MNGDHNKTEFDILVEVQFFSTTKSFLTTYIFLYKITNGEKLFIYYLEARDKHIQLAITDARSQISKSLTFPF